MWQRDGIRWGLFGIPDRWLPPIAGRVVVELGAGTAFFSAALARAGARPIAIDLNEDQLGTATRCQRDGPVFPLVQADAESVPLRDGCADLVVSEHGASVWCQPQRWVAEAARLLTPGGHLVFLTNSPLSTMCVPDQGPAGTTLQRGYADLGRMEFDGVEHHPTHGDWIAVLRAAGLEVEGLHELLAPDDAADHEFYDIAGVRWAQRWPAEDLWVARKHGLGSSS